MSLRWSEDELRRYEARVAGAADRVERAITVATSEAPTTSRRGRMNKTEARYARELELRLRAGEILEYGFEDTKLRLAPGAQYTPDFRVVMADGLTEFHEVKGHWREAARVRIKVAAERFPRYRFIALKHRTQRAGGGWDVEEFM